MFLDIDEREFEKMARAGFMRNVRIRAQTYSVAKERCRTLGLVHEGDDVYKLGDTFRASAADIYYRLIHMPSGFYLVRQDIADKSS